MSKAKQTNKAPKRLSAKTINGKLHALNPKTGKYVELLDETGLSSEHATGIISHAILDDAIINSGDVATPRGVMEALEALRNADTKTSNIDVIHHKGRAVVRLDGKTLCDTYLHRESYAVRVNV